MRRFLSLAVLLALAACQPSFEVYDLRCEGLVEPLAIDSTQPHFSWKIDSDSPMVQAAYEIEVGPELWNSGKVESPDQVMVPYAGKLLGEREQAWWRVRVWNQDGKASAWSPKQRFGVGVLNGLQGEWIGAVPGEGRQPLLRKVFEVEKAGKEILYVCSLGYHEAYLNGEKLSDAVMQPAVSQLDKRALIVAYEVSLRKGVNELIIAAGSGWYKPATFGTVYDGPLVKAELDIKGKPEVVTDASWEGAWSGRKDLGTWKAHRFGGEEIQAGIEPQWGPVDVVKVEGVVESQQMCEPIRVLETLEPASVEDLGEGRWLVDYGRTVNAMMDIKLPQLPAGTEVKATFSDHRHPDGHLEEATIGWDVYIASGGEDRFQNRFNHHLMRYMLLEGLLEAPEAANLKALRIGDDYPWEGSFESSDPELNAIYNLVDVTMRNLTYAGYMVDCATIEQLGYGGDGNASAQSLQSVSFAAPMYLNWLQAWADSQRPDGGLPHTAPNPYKAGGGPYWCSFIVQAPWRVYMNDADARLMERFYSNMKHWLDYVDAYTEDGLLKQWPTPPTPPYRWWYLGDWAAPEGVDVQDPASIDLVNNCALAQSYEDLIQMAAAMNLEADEKAYRQRLDALREKIHEAFYHDGLYASGSQIDMIYPLLTGVVPEGLEDQVVHKLKERTETLHNGHLATGLVGIPVLTEWVSRAGECDWMYGMLKQHGYPGYLHMIDNGATGVWEHWEGSRSRLHNCYNGIGSWFYQALGGITALEPGYRRVRIEPQIPAGLEWVKVTQPTPYGPITVERHGNEVHFEVPVGVTVEAN